MDAPPARRKEPSAEKAREVKQAPEERLPAALRSVEMRPPAMSLRPSIEPCQVKMPALGYCESISAVWKASLDMQNAVKSQERSLPGIGIFEDSWTAKLACQPILVPSRTTFNKSFPAQHALHAS